MSIRLFFSYLTAFIWKSVFPFQFMQNSGFNHSFYSKSDHKDEENINMLIESNINTFKKDFISHLQFSCETMTLVDVDCLSKDLQMC